MSVQSGLGPQMESFREARRKIEESVLPLATSVDGRRFSSRPVRSSNAVHDQGVRCVVIDLSSLPSREEQSLIAAAVLGDLWRRRQERRPVLIVIDEAHNVCPAEPPGSARRDGG